MLKQYLKYFLLFSLISLLSCSDDRTKAILPNTSTDPEIKADTLGRIRALAYLAQINKKQNTLFNIGTPEEIPFKGPKGTVIYFNLDDLLTIENKKVTFPISVELLEIFSPKDMILANSYSVSKENILTTAGEFYLRFKNNNNQEIKTSLNGSPIRLTLPNNPKIDKNMGLYYGPGLIDVTPAWTQPLLQPFYNFCAASCTREPPLKFNTSNYAIHTQDFGWISVARNFSGNLNKANIKFLDKNKDKKALTILIFPEVNATVNLVYPLQYSLPANKACKLFTMSIDANQQIYAKVIEFTARENLEVPIDLKKVSGSEFNTLLNSL